MIFLSKVAIKDLSTNHQVHSLYLQEEKMHKDIHLNIVPFIALIYFL